MSLTAQRAPAMPADADEAIWNSARRQLTGGLLTIIMPAFNLAHAIADNVRQVRSIFSGRLPFEIVVVDDGSTDGTRTVLEGMRANVPELRPLILETNEGKGSALRHGFEACHGSYVLLLDGDLDLPPEQVSGFFDIMERDQADVVIGSKHHPDSVLTYPWPRRVISTLYYGLVRWLIDLPVHDTQTGIKLFKREVLAYTFPRMLVKQFAFDLEILAIAYERGFRVAEAPVTLDFQAVGTLGCLRPRVVRQIMHDTLAIFYRLKILKYYRHIRDTWMPAPPPLVSIVIAMPRPSVFFDECLAGILRQSYRNYEVIVLPDEPSGRNWGPGVREMPTGRVRPAEKRNIGIREARGSIVAFLDDDAFPVDHWLRQAVMCFGDKTIAGVGGPASTPGTDPFLAKLGGAVYANRLVSGNYRYRYEPERVREVEDYPSCNLFIRTEALRTIGGFRTEFWPGEDTILCRDIVRGGGTILYDPRVQVYHHRRRLFGPHLRQIGRYARHRGYFAKKFPDTSRKLSYTIPSLWVIGLIAGALLAPFSTLIRLLYGTAVTAYALITFASCLQRRPHAWLLTWLGVMSTHVVYGTGFLLGLAARRMPGQPTAFDHPSEQAMGPLKGSR